MIIVMRKIAMFVIENNLNLCIYSEKQMRCKLFTKFSHDCEFFHVLLFFVLRMAFAKANQLKWW